MKRQDVPTLEHLDDMHQLMAASSSDTEDESEAVLLAVAEGTVAYVEQLQKKQDDYQAETLELQATMTEQATNALETLKKLSTSQDDQMRQVDAFDQARLHMQQHTEKRNKTYGKFFVGWASAQQAQQGIQYVARRNKR